jgi:hypothetical protein
LLLLFWSLTVVTVCDESERGKKRREERLKGCVVG